MESVVRPGEDTSHYHEYSAPYVVNTCQYITRYTGYHSGNQLFCQDWANIVIYWHYTILALTGQTSVVIGIPVCQCPCLLGYYIFWHFKE